MFKDVEDYLAINGIGIGLVSLFVSILIVGIGAASATWQIAVFGIAVLIVAIAVLISTGALRDSRR